MTTVAPHDCMTHTDPCDVQAETDHAAFALSRRGFLAATGGAGLIAATTGAFGARLAFASPENPAVGDVIVLLFLRGGADGLSLVAPLHMPTYQTLRPTIRVKDAPEFSDATGKAGLPLNAGGAVGSFPLSGTFAMHPGMSALHAGPWTNGHLAVVHAAGMPKSESDTRSHFDSERNWEIGSASFNYSTGYLNRYLAGQGVLDRVPAITIGGNLDRSLTGPSAAYSMWDVSNFGVQGYTSNSRAKTALTSWYDGGTGDVLLQTGANTLSAIGTMAGVTWASLTPQNGVTYPTNNGLGSQLKQIAQMIRANVGLRVACLDVGGWDTHDSMGTPEDPASMFRARATGLSGALTAFYNDLGTQMNEVTLMTMSEFGRTINENGSGGTDHGRGSAMFVMGRKIKGGVHGAFPSSIVDGPEGDLAVLNDYRRVASEVLSVRGNATNGSTIFPTYTPQTPMGLALA